MDSERIISRFEPYKGVIPPKSEIKILFQSTVYTGGSINEIFMCDIDDLELPLGFELKADAFGLNVAYETGENSAAATLALTKTTTLRPASTISPDASMRSGS